MRRQLDQRALRLASGERPVGWKAGFGSLPAREQFHLDGPLVGFLTDASLRPVGGVISLAGWTHPVAEPELAARLGKDLPGTPTESDVLEAVAALGPAFELADVHPPPADVEEVLAGNIFHRVVILGAPAPAPLDELNRLAGVVKLNGETVAGVDDLEALTGRVTEVIAHIAGTLSAVGETLSAGEVVICGSIIPPLLVQPGDKVEFALGSLPPISVAVS